VSPPSDLVAALAPVVAALEGAGAAYRIGGSVASSALGVPRSTLDVDVVTDLGPEQVAGFASALEADYYVDADMIRDAIARRACFNLIHLATMLKIDVFIVGLRPFDRVAFARRVDRPLGEEPDARTFALRSPEDVILKKLEGYRIGGEVSERQWTDAVGVLKIQGGRLDLDYLRRWAADLGVADLLAKALAHAGL
jgi:hypothetical protein